VAEDRVIIDTGPLVAFLVKEEAHHQWVMGQFQHLPAPFLTCEAVLTEAFFLVRKLPHGTAKFFTLLNSGLLDIDFSIIAEGAALEKLVQRYANVPMSLADACLVRLAKLHPRAVVFTLDQDFQIYRRDGRQPIPVLMP
jgi:predicted nucleic acid-binding protein